MPDHVHTTVTKLARSVVAQRAVRVNSVAATVTSAVVAKRETISTEKTPLASSVERVPLITTVELVVRRTLFGTTVQLFAYAIKTAVTGVATSTLVETVIRGAKTTIAGAAVTVANAIAVRGAKSSVQGTGTILGEITKVWNIAANATAAALMTLAEVLLIKEVTTSISGAATMTGDAEVLQLVSITADTTDVVMTDLFTAGQLSNGKDCVVKVNSGVYVYGSDTSTPGMRTGTASVAGTLILIVEGYVYGHGGAGGTTYGSCTAKENGFPGGTALLMEQDLTIDNNGSILGGGGGGGSGLSYYETYCNKGGCSCTASNKGTGGGGGAPYGAGGAWSAKCCGGRDGTAGGTATVSAAGSRGTYSCSGTKGWGGDGGAPGAAGSAGNPAKCNAANQTAAAGGAAGTAIDENGYTRTDI